MQSSFSYFTVAMSVHVPREWREIMTLALIIIKFSHLQTLSEKFLSTKIYLLKFFALNNFYVYGMYVRNGRMLSVDLINLLAFVNEKLLLVAIHFLMCERKPCDRKAYHGTELCCDICERK